ncbi:ABC transporter permease [Nocardioides sp. C4-1]|uniref:ABC transporter permease n=1 Tax=Nocardioides sp. C4-1 TaxID=3151851 RepID=UPI003267EE14
MSHPAPPPYAGPPSGPPSGPQQGLPPVGNDYIDISQTARISFARLVRVEVRKSLDTLSGFWLIVAIAVLLIIVDGFVLIVGLATGDSGFRFVDFTVGAAFVLQPLLAVLLIMQVTSEWSQRTAVVTFATEPRRLLVVYAKLAAGVMLSLGFVVVLFVVALACAGLLGLTRDTVEWSFGPGQFFGLLLFEMVAVVIGFALATLILNTPGAIVAFFAVLYGAPTVFGIVGAFWTDFQPVGRFLNLQAALNPAVFGELSSGRDWAELLVALLVWVALPLGLGMTRILRAEVK